MTASRRRWPASRRSSLVAVAARPRLAPSTPASSRPAALAGVDEVYRRRRAPRPIGRAGLRHRVDPPVDVIVGPGNVHVALAKREVRRRGLGRRARRRFAGPSRSSVGGRRHGAARPPAAVDVILQAEHGPDGLAWLVTLGRGGGRRRRGRGRPAGRRSPRRADIEATLAEGGYRRPRRQPRGRHGRGQRHRPRAPRAARATTPSRWSAAGPPRRRACSAGRGRPASIGDYLAGPEPRAAHLRRRPASPGPSRLDDFIKPVHVVTARPRVRSPPSAPRPSPSPRPRASTPTPSPIRRPPRRRPGR